MQTVRSRGRVRPTRARAPPTALRLSARQPPACVRQGSSCRTARRGRMGKLCKSFRARVVSELFPQPLEPTTMVRTGLMPFFLLQAPCYNFPRGSSLRISHLTPSWQSFSTERANFMMSSFSRSSYHMAWAISYSSSSIPEDKVSSSGSNSAVCTVLPRVSTST